MDSIEDLQIVEAAQPKCCRTAGLNCRALCWDHRFVCILMALSEVGMVVADELASGPMRTKYRRAVE